MDKGLWYDRDPFLFASRKHLVPFLYGETSQEKTNIVFLHEI
jgi:hypothetical protein